MTDVAKIICSRCLLHRPVTEFYPRTNRARGYLSHCKSCMDKAQIAKRRIAKAKATKNALLKSTIRICRECNRLLPFESFPIRNSGTPRRYFVCEECKAAKHPPPHDTEYYQQQNARWKRNNPDKVNSYTQNRRARIRKDGGTVSSAEWRAMKHFFNYCCLMCERKDPEIRLTWDHVIPIAVGGRHTIMNLQPLCKSCNSRKHQKTLDLRNATFFEQFPKIVKLLKEGKVV